MLASVSRRVTIGDVAAAAGVSIATVSKVINDRYGVAPATLAKVRAVIDDLGYEGSLVARSLRSQRTNVIGVLVPDIEPFSAELLKGAADAIRQHSYELIVYSAGGHGTEFAGWERRNVARLSGTLTDGIILVAPTVDDVNDAAPVVAVDPHSGSGRLPSVHADNLAGAFTATEHLIGLGHRRIGFVAGRPDLDSASQREQGWRRALAAAGIAVDEQLVAVGDYTPDHAADAATQLLTSAEPPTAIFAANDLSAIRTIKVARALGLSVPDDLSVIGFDNIPESAACDPPLTTIDQSIQEMGRRAAEWLIEMIDARAGGAGGGSEHGDPPQQITLPTRLVIRQSCRAIGA